MQLTLIFSPTNSLLVASLHVWDAKASSTPPRRRPSIRPCFVACTASGEFSQIFAAQATAVSTPLPRGTTSFTLRMVKEDKVTFKNAHSQPETVTSLYSGHISAKQEHLCGELIA